MTYTIIRDGDQNEFSDESEFRDMCDLLDEKGVEYETEEPKSDGGEAPPIEEEPVVQEVVDENDENSGLTDVAQFQQDPISYLKSINTEFVNRIKGNPAISKRGFRFMQAELGISTSSELVATFDDPMGVVIHARAEMPDGRFAEAHGEGYLTESDVSDNEFVRYSDTRAKNRAISDLTSSGALAESELTE